MSVDIQSCFSKSHVGCSFDPLALFLFLPIVNDKGARGTAITPYPTVTQTNSIRHSAVEVQAISKLRPKQSVYYYEVRDQASLSFMSIMDSPVVVDATRDEIL